MKIISITGGVGSGKSEVLRVLQLNVLLKSPLPRSCPEPIAIMELSC